MSSESKITLYLALSNEQKRSELEMAFMTEYLDIAVFALADKNEYDQRLKLNPPQLIVADVGFLAGNSILRDGVTMKERAQTSYIVLGAYPEKDEFLDEMMMGKFQFFETEPSDDDWKVAVKKAFKFSFDVNSAAYVMKNIKMG
jgi:DNA-binding NtrC family response regulator